ncbi:VOC family protein [Nocardia sp. NPDC059246]|uniref:VOC family protein n=1 Tax=unclassified Nocardia TaxID=2637762 RepID=UPI0036A9CFD6
MRIVKSYTPVRVESERFAPTLDYYEQALGLACDLHFRFEAGDLDIATIGPVVLIGGPADALASAPRQDMVISVDSLEEWQASLLARGATLVTPQADIPTGRNMMVRNPDGTLFEYVQWSQAKLAAVDLSRSAQRVSP